MRDQRSASIRVPVAGPQASPRPGDAFGEILRACWAKDAQTGAAFEVIERDDGFIGVSDASSYFAPPTPQDLDLRACERATGRVLDVGRGAGRHAVAMARAGLEVVGLDTSPGAVEVTKSRGVPAYLGSVADLPDVLGTFDSFVLLGNNLGLLDSTHRAPAVLAALTRLARPGARLYGTCIDPGGTDDPTHIAYHGRNRMRTAARPTPHPNPSPRRCRSMVQLPVAGTRGPGRPGGRHRLETV